MLAPLDKPSAGYSALTVHSAAHGNCPVGGNDHGPSGLSLGGRILKKATEKAFRVSCQSSPSSGKTPLDVVLGTGDAPTIDRFGFLGSVKTS